MEIKPVSYVKEYQQTDNGFEARLVEKKSKNRHSFTLESNGYRLVFHEDEEKYRNEPYCCRFSLVSYDKNDDYAYVGIGKKEQNDAASFADAIEKEMLELSKKRKDISDDIEKLQRMLSAIDEFSEILPKIMLEDGIDNGTKRKHRRG